MCSVELAPFPRAPQSPTDGGGSEKEFHGRTRNQILNLFWDHSGFVYIIFYNFLKNGGKLLNHNKEIFAYFTMIFRRCLLCYFIINVISFCWIEYQSNFESGSFCISGVSPYFTYPFYWDSSFSPQHIIVLRSPSLCPRVPHRNGTAEAMKEKGTITPRPPLGSSWFRFFCPRRCWFFTDPWLPVILVVLDVIPIALFFRFFILPLIFFAVSEPTGFVGSLGGRLASTDPDFLAFCADME